MYKPVILLGNGIRQNPSLVEHLCSLGVPTLFTWMAADMGYEDLPTYCGRPGILGQRAANIIQQKADLLLAVGARMDGEQVAYNYDGFAPNAFKFVFDTDIAEWAKFPIGWHTTNKPETIDKGFVHQVDPAWLSWCKSLYARLRPELDGAPAAPGYIDPFAFISALSDVCQADDMLAIGSSGMAPCSFLQAFKVKQGQRITNCSTIGAMGADIPMAIGAAVASGRRTICVTGDGGFQLNAQELEVARRLHLPITFFVYNNNGYGSIRAMQDTRFAGRHVGCDPDSGLTLPGLRGIARAYGVDYWRLPDISYRRLMEQFVSGNGPRIVEVPIDPTWRQFPRVGSSMQPDGSYSIDPMERMTPYLPDGELEALMAWDGD